MQIIDKNIIELKPYKKNPRKNDNAVAPVAESIKEFGFKVPIIVDKDNVIVARQTALQAAVCTARICQRQMYQSTFMRS